MEGESTTGNPGCWRRAGPSQRIESADPSGSGGWSGEGVRDAVESGWARESDTACQPSHRSPPWPKVVPGGWIDQQRPTHRPSPTRRRPGHPRPPSPRAPMGLPTLSAGRAPPLSSLRESSPLPSTLPPSSLLDPLGFLSYTPLLQHLSCPPTQLARGPQYPYLGPTCPSRPPPLLAGRHPSQPSPLAARGGGRRCGRPTRQQRPRQQRPRQRPARRQATSGRLTRQQRPRQRLARQQASPEG